MAANSEPLKIATHEAPPYVIRSESGALQGITIDLWNEIARELDIDFEFVEMSVADAVDGLSTGEVDGAALALTATAARERQIDFSHPYGSAGQAMAMEVQRSNSWLRLLQGVVSWQFLSAVFALAAVLAAAAVCVWLFERQKNAEQFGGKTHRGLGNSFWWSAVTMTTVGYGDMAPKTLGGRVVALIWMFTSVIVISGFTASIASSITTSNIVSETKRQGDFAEIITGVVEGTTGAQYVAAAGGRSRSYDGLDTAIAAMLSREVDAVVYDAPVLRYKAHRDFDGAIEVLPGILQREDYAFGFPEGSIIRDQVDLAVLERISNGRISEIVRRYLGEEN